MVTPRFFTRQVITPDTKPDTSSKFRLSFSKIFTIIVILLAFAYLSFQVYNVGARVVSNWQEIMFAYEKPELVHATRVSYQRKETALDKSFEEQKQTAQEKLINAVTTKLQASK